eukprot:GEMP01063501.1.p1 GENE.GEMP01063501.1~~GEMP01063501.1.p1  ORF type:complete len:233 (-),score=15.86 GEMP01063501.1:2-700(-)
MCGTRLQQKQPSSHNVFSFLCPPPPARTSLTQTCVALLCETDDLAPPHYPLIYAPPHHPFSASSEAHTSHFIFRFAPRRTLSLAPMPRMVIVDHPTSVCCRVVACSLHTADQTCCHSANSCWHTRHFPPVAIRIAHLLHATLCPHGTVAYSIGATLQKTHVLPSTSSDDDDSDDKSASSLLMCFSSGLTLMWKSVLKCLRPYSCQAGYCFSCQSWMRSVLGQWCQYVFHIWS